MFIVIIYAILVCIHGVFICYLYVCLQFDSFIEGDINTVLTLGEISSRIKFQRPLYQYRSCGRYSKYIPGVPKKTLPVCFNITDKL